MVDRIERTGLLIVRFRGEADMTIVWFRPSRQRLTSGRHCAGDRRSQIRLTLPHYSAPRFARIALAAVGKLAVEAGKQPGIAADGELAASEPTYQPQNW